MAAQRLKTRPQIVEVPLLYQERVNYRPQSFVKPDSHDDDYANIPKNLVTVPIHNLRGRNPDYDVEGFAIYPHKSKLRDIRDRPFLEGEYSRELHQALLDITGCRRAIITKNIAARLSPLAKDFPGERTMIPSPVVHADYNERTGPAAVARYVSPGELKDHRFAIFSLWRVISDPPQDNTICLCDARTVSEEDRQYVDVYIGTGPIENRRKMEFTGYTYSPNHLWGYFRDMRRDELLFIKLYDSDDSKSWRGAHTGFEDPSAGPAMVPRESVDIRGIAIW